MKQLLEQKHGTRIIVFALLLTMLAWLAPANVGVVKAAEGDTKIPVTGGYLIFDKATGAITNYEGEITDVVIPEMFEGTKITSIGGSTFRYCSSLASVSIPVSITTIGNYAFEYCSSLTSIDVEAGNQNYSSQAGVLFDRAKEQLIQCPIGNKRTSYEIPNSVTSIENYAFKGCRGLTNVTIPNSIDSIGYGAFHGCSSLTSVSIPDSVTSIEYEAFCSCSSLTSVIIPDNVTTIEDGAFWDCSSLTNVIIPGSVTFIGERAFRGCSSLTSITIPYGVTTIEEYAFYESSGLTSITIPDSVISIGDYTFGYQWDESSEDEIKVPGFKIYGYSNDSAAAKYAKGNGFEYIVINNANPGGSNQGGNNNQGGNSNNQGNQNGDTGNNKGGNGPNNVPAVTTKVGTTVKDKKSNGSYIVAKTNQTGGTVTYKAPMDKKKTSVTIPATVKIEGKTYKVTAIEKNAFKGSKKLKTIKIGSNVEKIGDNAFNKCANLKKVTIPSKVKTIQKGAFAGCKNLKTITIQTKKLTKKTVGAGAFKGVSSKATVKVPKGKAKAYKTLLRSKGLSKKAKIK